MIPLLPCTPLVRSAEFVTQEWNDFFSNGRVDQIAGGWRGILYANYATIDPKGAWKFFADANFDPSWLDGGASLTWYLAYAAGKFLLMTLLGMDGLLTDFNSDGWALIRSMEQDLGATGYGCNFHHWIGRIASACAYNKVVRLGSSICGRFFSFVYHR